MNSCLQFQISSPSKKEEERKKRKKIRWIAAAKQKPLYRFFLFPIPNRLLTRVSREGRFFFIKYRILSITKKEMNSCLQSQNLERKRKKKKDQVNSSIEPKATLSILFIANELAPT